MVIDIKIGEASFSATKMGYLDAIFFHTTLKSLFTSV